MTSTPKLPPRKYTREDKEQFALQWLLHGNVSKASAAIGVPRQTAQLWMKSRWWGSLIDRMRLIHKEEIESKYEHIITKAADGLLDRLENGDEVMTKGGKMTRIKVKARDLAGVMGTTQDKLRISRNQPNNISVSATLNMRELASNFARAGRTYQLELNGRGDKDKDKLPYFGQLGNNTDDINEVEYVEIDESNPEETEGSGVSDGTA